MLADCSNRSPTGSLSFFSWNINGIFAKPLGDKLQNNECLNLICQFDFVILCETWKETIIDVKGYRSVVSGTTKLGNNGRNSGRVALLYKNELHNWVSIEQITPNFLWFRISKQYVKTITKTIYVGKRLYTKIQSSSSISKFANDNSRIFKWGQFSWKC